MTIHKLTLFPSNDSYEVNSEEVLLVQLKKLGINLKSGCAGHASCGDCVVKIKGGEFNLCPPTFGELKLLGNVFHITKERLTCQTKIIGDVVIDITNHEKYLDDVAVVSKKPQVIVKKRENIERKSQDKVEDNSDPSWYRHWEKQSESEPGQKRIGGNKRPKAFKHSKPDNDEE